MFHSIFTDYPLADFPPIPSGWVETSWRNDACPSFQFVVDGETMRVFIDYADPDRRECPNVPRFGLTTEDGVPVFETDNWESLLAEAVKPRFPVSLEGDVIIGRAACAEWAFIVAENYFAAHRMHENGWELGESVSFGEWTDDDGETVKGWIVPLLPAGER